MDPLTMAGLALTIIEGLIPKVEEWVKAGDITPQEQAARKARADELQARLDNATLFTGPQWQQSGRTA